MVAIRLIAAGPTIRVKGNIVGFYGPEPFEDATATYVWTGFGGPGFFVIEVSGNAPDYTSGITLVRDQQFVGGLAVDVMGWTGPLGKGTTPYTVEGRFPGQFHPTIYVKGRNKTMAVEVNEIPEEDSEHYLMQLAGAAV